MTLHVATAMGKVQRARQLLAAGAAVDARSSSQGVTPLHLAVQHPDPAVAVEMTRQLLAAGAAVNATSLSGSTALAYACVEGHAEVVRQLLAEGAAADAADPRGSTPLHHAAQGGHLSAVQLLVAAAPEAAAAENVSGELPLHYALAHSHFTHYTHSFIPHVTPLLHIAFYNSTSRAHSTCNAPLATWLVLAAADWWRRWVVWWVARPATRCPMFENAHTPTDKCKTQKDLRAS
jgi:ankyrin repeat protein